MQNHNQHMYVLLYHERNTFCYFFFGSPPIWEEQFVVAVP